MWYGVKIDGEIEYVMRWDRKNRPTLFDFNCGFNSFHDYEIVEVDVQEYR